MKNRFEEKHLALLKATDPEVTDFYADWLCMRESNEFETTAHLLAHLAREILRGLQDRVPEDVVKIYDSIIHFFDKFSHRREGGKAPRPKESFNQIWTEFENLLVYLVENRSDFYNTSNYCPFATLQNSLKQLETETSESLETEWMIPDVELAPHQSEISQNLERIAPLFAAFYRDWVRMRRSTNFQCRSYILAHLAREVDSGLRGALSTKQGRKRMQKRLQKEDLGDLKEHIGYIVSIMEALGVSDFCLRVEQWIQTVKDLANLTHRDRDHEAKLLRNEVESLWPKVEELWVYLVGSYLKLLNRVDRILAYKDEPPTDEQIKEALRNLLKFDGVNQYFFDKLKSPAWLKILKEDECFDPDQNPAPQEDPNQLGEFYTPTWHALEYVARVALHPDSLVDILVDIVNDIIASAGDYRKRINNKWTDWQTIKIIGAFPTDQIRCRHIAFMGITLKSKYRSGLVDQEISQTILPKLLEAGAKELTLILLKVMFDSKVVEDKCDAKITEAAKESTLDLLRAMFGAESVNHEIITDVETYEPKSVNREITYMQEHCLRDAFKEHRESIAKLCGVKAANIAIEQIKNLIAEGVTSFERIQLVRTAPSNTLHESYAELLVGFVSYVLRFAEPTTIAQMLEDLLQVPQTIIRRITIAAVTYHYSDLKRMFWQWRGNPLEEVSLKPELYQLIQTNCTEFKECEIEQILDWIELAQYTAIFAKDDETRSKAAAYRKREWISALLETGNENVIAAYEKYKKINPAKIENPGSLSNIEIWAGSTSPLTVERMSAMSNVQIAKYLANFKEPEIVIRKSDPTEEGLAKTLNECVTATPQRFTDNLQPFQDVRNFYQNWLLHGFLAAWRDKKEFDWAALLEYIRQLLLSKRFWTEQHTAGYNYRQWTLVAIAELITSGTENDERAFDAQLLPLAEQVLLVLVEKVEPSDLSFVNRSLDILSSDRSKVFSAVINYALRFAFINDTTQRNCRWPQAIREDLTKRLNSSVEPSSEFYYTLGAYLPDLSYLDEEWVVDNLPYIFPQQDELRWQAAFSGYLLYPQIYEYLYSLLKTHGHYQKAIDTNFADDEVIEALVAHICIGWVQDWEILNDDTSLIYQLINGGTPGYFSAIVHFFLEQSDKLEESDKPEKVKAYEQVKAKIKPAWNVLFEKLSKNSELVEYQEVLGPLSGWLGLIDTIDVKVLNWVKVSIRYINKPSNYYLTISRLIKALLEHVSKTPRAMAEIYLQIPQCVLTDLQMEEDDIKKTVRILYNRKYTDVADNICEQFGKAGVYFLRPIYEEHQI